MENIIMTEQRKQELIRLMGESLSALRSRAGWTQEMLAEYLGVSRQTILLIEHQKRLMTWSTFLALVFLFSLSPGSKAMMLALKIYPVELEKQIRLF